MNAGYRFPGVGACDYPACRKLADCRTYVHLAGEPNFKHWLAAAAEGRSFMTSGPLVLLEVDGKLPGDTIETADDKPRSLQARVRVLSEAAPVTDVQLVVNGQVVAGLEAAAENGRRNVARTGSHHRVRRVELDRGPRVLQVADRKRRRRGAHQPGVCSSERAAAVSPG